VPAASNNFFDSRLLGGGAVVATGGTALFYWFHKRKQAVAKAERRAPKPKPVVVKPTHPLIAIIPGQERYAAVRALAFSNFLQMTRFLREMFENRYPNEQFLLRLAAESPEQETTLRALGLAPSQSREQAEAQWAGDALKILRKLETSQVSDIQH